MSRALGSSVGALSFTREHLKCSLWFFVDDRERGRIVVSGGKLPSICLLLKD